MFARQLFTALCKRAPAVAPRHARRCFAAEAKKVVKKPHVADEAAKAVASRNPIDHLLIGGGVGMGGTVRGHLGDEWWWQRAAMRR